MRWNEHKDHSGGSVEVKFMGETGAFFAASTIWEETYLMDAGNAINKARVLHHMMGFEQDSRLFRNFTREEYTDIQYGAIPNIRRAGTR